MATKYKDWAPSQFDTMGLCLEDRQDWLVAPVILTRDSGPRERSNWRVVVEDLRRDGCEVEIHRFGHWACGWFEIALVYPAGEPQVTSWEGALDDYPIADDEDFSYEEQEEANAVWANCYTGKERLSALRVTPYPFDSMADMVGAVRGRWCPYHASEFLAKHG